MSPIYLAHSPNFQGRTHSLKAHLAGVRKLISVFARFPKIKKNAELAALLHDLGKYLAEFQAYLQHDGRRGSVPHAKWGAILAWILGANEVSFAVAGHHAGMPDAVEWRTMVSADEKKKEQTAELLAVFLRDMAEDENALLALREKLPGSAREKDVYTRFIFSCLTDADWQNTENHFSPGKTKLRETNRLETESFITQVDAKLNSLERHVTPLNALRSQSRLAALAKADSPTGFFSLNLPTGLGKTLTSFRWALEHAKANELERIIIVLPYTSIIDQTAERLKDILGQDAVLEHHSSSVADESEENETRKNLACENWDHPVIVTTSVQFFETLFSNRPQKCRKLHNTSRSVIILDEVQTLPKDLIVPTLDMLQDMCVFLQSSVVFCTATMPAFEKRPKFPGIDRITHLADDARGLFEQTRRVRYKLLDDLRAVPTSRLEQELQKQTQSTLVVCNTKRLVRDLYETARLWDQWDHVFHLSTSMCPHHRKERIRRITTLVKETQLKILVVSTQLVEAGVDMDFPAVFRELAPLESVIQAAGRCNREGTAPEDGAVTLFYLEDARYPAVFYKTQTDVVRALLQSDADSLMAYETFHKYYAQVIDMYVEQKPITPDREKQNFSKVSSQYKIIENNTRSLFIWSYNEDSKKLYATIRAKEKHNIPLFRKEFREMQQYSVQTYEAALQKTRGLWEESACGTLVWNGGYDSDMGLVADPRTTDALIL